MAAALNGMAVSKIRPFGGTFFNFSDYMRPSIRLAALMEIPTIYVFTHDSIGLGEDGPTHQPIEQLASLRAMPGLDADAPGGRERSGGSLESHHASCEHEPAALVLKPAGRAHLRSLEIWLRVRCRQGRIHPGRCRRRQAGSDSDGHWQRSFAVRQRLRAAENEGIKARVVSMPSWDLFDSQSDEYKAKVLPPEVKARVAVEQAATFGWSQYVGPTGTVIGMRRFGASAPIKDLQKKFGFTTENVVAAARKAIGK